MSGYESWPTNISGDLPLSWANRLRTSHGSGYFVSLNRQGANIYSYAGMDRSAFNAYVAMEYTKD